MKKTVLKRILILLVLFMFGISIIPSNATYASGVEINSDVEENEEENIIAGEYIDINPIYKNLYHDFNKKNRKTIHNRSIDSRSFVSKKSAADYLRKEMINRNDSISLNIESSSPNTIYKEILELAFEEDGNNSSAGDYLLLNYSGARISYSYYPSSTTVSITYELNYLSSYDQERMVDLEVKKVLDSLDVYDKDEYTKIKAVHDYIMQNIHYDYSYSNHSAYNAIINKNVVCQGYASLTYKMMKELGVGVRAIVGNQSNHAWNIVRINEKWYNIDNTWDSNYTDSYNYIRYDWFLKSEKDFVEHIRDEKYTTSDFIKQYPMSEESYKRVSVSSLSLNKASLDINVGSIDKLEATVLPSNASDKSVIWRTTDKGVATVDKNGKVTGMKAGTATITVTTRDGNIVKRCKVTVKNPVVLVTGISLNKTSLSIDKKTSTTLVASVLPSNATNKGVIWRTTDKSIATVDQNGKVTGVSAGMATITVTTNDGNMVGRCKVTVKNPTVSVTGISLNKTSVSIAKNTSTTLIATVSPSNATDKGVIWRTTDKNIVTVDQKGKITAVKSGTATITVTTNDGNIVGRCKVTVK